MQLTPGQRALAAKQRAHIKDDEPIGAAFWCTVSSRGAGNLDDILAQRRHSEVWERGRRGEATDVEVLEAYMDAYVPRGRAARMAYLREAERKDRALGGHMTPVLLDAIAAVRRREQLKDHDPDSPDDAAGSRGGI
jgi:hypothetical protein